MNRIMLALRSRTFWTLVAMFLIGGVHAVGSTIPATFLPYVEGGLGLIATYFHVNPSQNYNG